MKRDQGNIVHHSMAEDSMKRAMILLVSILFTSVMATTLYAQNAVDVSGTWVGTTDFPNTPDKDDVTLILKKQGTSFSGTITAGKLKDIPCEKLVFSDEDSFSFEFVLDTGDSKTRIAAKLNYESDTILGTHLMGAWSIESGEYGVLEFERKK
jgi:hypothetical protein